VIVRVKLPVNKSLWDRLLGRVQPPDEQRQEVFMPRAWAVADTKSDVTELEQIPAEEALIRPESRIAFHTNPRSLAAHRFRFLRTVLRECWNTGKLKKLLVTSALPEDGKSTVALNVATALAEGGDRKVLLIEADLYRPHLCRDLGLTARSGLGECLQNGANPLSFIRRVHPLGWYLLPAGDMAGESAEHFHSPAFSRVMQALSPRFDWIVIDSPPLLPVSDAVMLARQTDGSLLVVRADSTPAEAVEQAVALIGSKHVLSIVLNGAEEIDHYYSKYEGYGEKRQIAAR
jgi:capsular exopolysaccharide synthesis family protein